MCIPSAPRMMQAPAPLPAVAPPPPPAPISVMAPPTVPGTAEKNPQKKAKTYAQRRRAASGGVSGKARFTIPLGGTGGGSVNS